MSKKIFTPQKEGHGTEVLCYTGAWNSNSLPNIVKRFKEFLDTFHPKCRWCGTDLSLGEIYFYEHPNGLLNIPVDSGDPEEFSSKAKRFWIYVECPKCKHQWSFVKLGFGKNDG